MKDLAWKAIIWCIIIFLGALVFYDHSSSKVSPTSTPPTFTTPDISHDDYDIPSSVEDGETYEFPYTFYGYDCTDDCSGHEAGYEWAAEQGIVDIEDCSGNSDSFIEGCQAYAEEAQEEYEEAYEDSYYDDYMF